VSDSIGITTQTDRDRIKKAYRKKALELHPDRNYGNVENATKKFAEVQSAYEILSDPQERAWYDSHRDAILRNQDMQGDEYYEDDVRVTTADDITKMFGSFDGHIDYSDSQRGFYNTLGRLFDTLAQEEAAACERQGIQFVDYPSFGSSIDTYEGSVRTFYVVWMNFTTKKEFSWKEIYRYSEAPDRRVRRMMEKENKRCREEHIREFNEAVRAMVAFVRKRDPRYTPNRQTEADRQKQLREIAAAQAAKSRAANEAKLTQNTVPLWAKIERHAGDETDTEEDEEETKEQFECVLCKKTFKSEKQWEVHEKSKKHVKAVQDIRRRMRADDEALGLNALSSASGAAKELPTDEEEDPEAYNADQYRMTSPQEKLRNHQQLGAPPSPTSNFKDMLGSSTVLGTSYKDVTEDVSQNTGLDAPEVNPKSSEALDPSIDVEDISHGIHSATLTEDDSGSTRPKIGKAKAKRAKKAAKVTALAGDTQQEVCTAKQYHDPTLTKDAIIVQLCDLSRWLPLEDSTFQSY
jgi:DnaJ family protein A protein 5